MIGQGSPSNRFAVLVRFALAARGAREICLLVVFCTLSFSVGDVSFGQSSAGPSGLGLRIVWGGGEPAKWVGSITVSSGELDRLVPLGLGRDDNATIWLSSPKLNVRQHLSGTYNGCDVRVKANRDATLSFDFTNKENIATHWTRKITLRELIAGPVTFELDSQHNRISVQRTPGDELQVEFEQDHLIFATKSTVKLNVRPVETGFAPSAEGKLRIFTRASGTEKSSPLAEIPLKSNEAGEILPLEPISLSVPDAEGVYDWDIVLIENPVFQVVRVLPDITAEERRSPVRQHAVLVGQRHDLQALCGPVYDEERPPRAEVFCGRVGEESLKPLERAEVPRDRVGDRALRRSVRVRCEDVPEELMVGVAPAIVANRRPNRFRHLVEVAQQVLDREPGELRIRLERFVQVVDVRCVMLVVVELHRLRIDVGLERVVTESQGRKLVCHV